MNNIVYVIYKDRLGNIMETTGLLVADDSKGLVIKASNLLKGNSRYIAPDCRILNSEILYREMFRVSRSTL